MAACNTDIESLTIQRPLTYDDQYYQNLRDYKEEHIRSMDVLSDNRIDLFFEACVEAARESVYNALCMADDMTGIGGKEYKGFNPRDFASLLPLK